MSSFLFSSYLLHFNCKFVAQKKAIHHVLKRTCFLARFQKKPPASAGSLSSAAKRTRTSTVSMTTRSLILRVCQFRHRRVNKKYYTRISESMQAPFEFF